MQEAMSLVTKLKPGLLIVDISLDGNNGVELMKNLSGRPGSPPILAYSMHDESIYAERCLRAGAKGYVMKHSSPEILLEAMRQVLKGKIYLSEPMSDRLLGKLVGAGSRHWPGDIANRYAQRSRVGGASAPGQGPDDCADRRQPLPERQNRRNVSRAPQAEVEPRQWAGTAALRDRVEPEFAVEVIFIPSATRIFQLAEIPATPRLIRSLTSTLAGDAGMLRAVVDLLPVGVVIAHDIECKTLSANRAAARMLGISFNGNETDIVSAELRLAQNGKPLASHQTPMFRAAASGQELRDVELELIRGDGTVVYICEHASPIRDDSGKVVGCIGVIVDITAQHHNDEALEQRVAERTSDAQHRADQFATWRWRWRMPKRASASDWPNVYTTDCSSFCPQPGSRQRWSGESSPTILRPRFCQVERMLEQAIDESRRPDRRVKPAGAL